jgi:hypothetical protein
MHKETRRSGYAVLRRIQPNSPRDDPNSQTAAGTGTAVIEPPEKVLRVILLEEQGSSLMQRNSPPMGTDNRIIPPASVIGIIRKKATAVSLVCTGKLSVKNAKTLGELGELVRGSIVE